MIIKKFIAKTEKEAVLMAKEEMGNDAIVLNIKKIKHHGIKRFFKKDSVEVTAALEEKSITGNLPVEKVNSSNLVGENQENGNSTGFSAIIDDKLEKQNKAAIEEKLDTLQSMIEQRMINNDSDNVFQNDAKKKENIEKEKNVNFACMQLIYNQLLENDVDEKYANQIIGEIESSLKRENNLDVILSAVYQKIVLKLGAANTIQIEEDRTKVTFFVGPTGVGKTTTIAKIASYYKLEKKAKIAMITSDTYRIAAVEQLRTYANILDVPLEVVYTIEELNSAINKFEGYDLILIDTAGRSHKNKEQCEEMIHFVNDCETGEKCDKEVFLVLNASTKYKDLLDVVNVYKEVGDYSIVFTKLDETSSLGNILNIRLSTQHSLSYITSGQTVPDDISIMNAQKLAKSLLGGGE